jgi:hypothetical protein
LQVAINRHLLKRDDDQDRCRQSGGLGADMTVPPELLEALVAYRGEVKHCKPGKARAKRRPRDPMLVQAEEAFKRRRQERREREAPRYDR